VGRTLNEYKNVHEGRNYKFSEFELHFRFWCEVNWSPVDQKVGKFLE